MKNGMFTGWKEVFRFTFEQNIKTKSFKTALVSISALLFIIFFAVNMGAGYYKDSKKPDKVEENTIKEIFVLNDTGIDSEQLIMFNQYSEFAKDVKVMIADKTDDINQIIEESNQNGTEIMAVEISEKTEDEDICFEILVKQSEACSDKMVNNVSNEFMEYFDECKLISAGIDEGTVSIITSGSVSYAVDVKEAEKSLGEILMGVFMPMIVVFVMYMLVLMHGQSISKIIVIEKNSKLMETLLISVKPYAIILGKILAMYIVAVIEVFVWVLSGIAGYLISDKIAAGMFQKYENPIGSVIKIMKNGAGHAFTPEAVAVCVLAVLIGFFAYCVLAGLITSNITKAEDLANGTSIYQMIVVAGFILSYFLPLIKSESPLINILRYVPVTSVFMLPADILMGSISIAGSLISILILFVVIAVMIVLTGKIYKKKVF